MGNEQSIAAGKAARARAPLESHREFNPGPDRDLAVSYAAQNERDHAALAEAVASGRAEAKTGV